MTRVRRSPSASLMRAWKVFTHDLRPPVRGGDPVWDGSLPYTLPPVEVDTGQEECSAGWNACATAETALRIAGLWPAGRPSRLFAVATDGPVIERGDKLRAATWTILREASDAEVREAIYAMSGPFGDLRDAMVDEQVAWRHALGRPRSDSSAVEEGLGEALRARGLDWKLREYQDAGSAWDAGAAWSAWDAGDAGAAWSAGSAWDAWSAGSAGDAWAAWSAWSAWDAGAAGDAGPAWDAIMVFYASSRGWVDMPCGKLTAGLRSAYENGLGVALPVEAGILGWSMGEAKR